MYFIIIQASSHRTDVAYKPKNDANITLPSTRSSLTTLGSDWRANHVTQIPIRMNTVGHRGMYHHFPLGLPGTCDWIESDFKLVTPHRTLRVHIGLGRQFLLILSSSNSQKTLNYIADMKKGCEQDISNERGTSQSTSRLTTLISASLTRCCVITNHRPAHSTRYRRPFPSNTWPSNTYERALTAYKTHLKANGSYDTRRRNDGECDVEKRNSLMIAWASGWRSRSCLGTV